MIGIAIGDYLGSTFEENLAKGVSRCSGTPFRFTVDNIPEGSKFTDDTYLSFALIESLLTDKPFYKCLKDWTAYYPHAGYGRYFIDWVNSNKTSYRSYGNGAAVRATILGNMYPTDYNKREEIVRKYTSVTHGHPEAMKAAILTGHFAGWFRANMGKYPGRYGCIILDRMRTGAMMLGDLLEAYPCRLLIFRTVYY